MAVSGLRSCSSRTRTSRNGPLTRRRGMTCRGMLHLPALLGTLAAALLMACAVALLAVSGEAAATFNVEKFEPRGGQVYDGVDANQQAGDTVAVSTRGGPTTPITCWAARSRSSATPLPDTTRT